MASKKTAAPVEAGTSNPIAKAGAKAKVPKIPKATDPIPLHPTTLTMVMEALRKNTDRKGASVPSIRAYILSTYPSVDSVRLRVLLRKALANGMEKGLLMRPTNSTATGATGRFKLAPAKPKTLKKLSQKTDQNGEQPPKVKKTVSKKPRSAVLAGAKKPKASGDTAKKTVKKVAAGAKGEAAAPKAKGDPDKAVKVAAKKPKEKVAAKEPAKAKTNEKKAASASTTSKADNTTDKDSAKPAATKRGKK
ncbi:histone H1.8 [Ambystoma mexicanum]|uniref:histone H1.8 n=1 Tax=Ambystoma mexicanum TaxID=8296 RepID=UPI0037E8DC1B